MKAAGLPLWLVVLCLLLLSLLHLPSFIAEIEVSADPWSFNGDARQAVAPFSRDDTLINDYVLDYERSLVPLGARLVYSAAGRIGCEKAVSKVSAWILYFVVLAATGATAWRLGGPASFVSSLALLLSSRLIFYRMSGGLPRSFAFPLFATAYWALAADRPRIFAVLVVAAAAFYPSAAVPLGLGLAAWLLLSPGELVEKGLTLRRRLFILGLSAILCLCLVAPIIYQARPYGRRLGPSDIEAFPEISATGRYGVYDRWPFLSLPAALADIFGRSFETAAPWSACAHRLLYEGAVWGRPNRTLVFALTLSAFVLFAGLWPLSRENRTVRLFVCCLLCASLSYLIACRVYPALFLPQRFILYPVPLLLFLLFPLCLKRLFASDRIVLVITVAFLLVLGGRGINGSSQISVREHERRVIEFVSSLKGPLLLAGWPNGVINSVPYLACRPALITYETHQCFHEKYTLCMRGRMDALIKAYFDPSPLGLSRLRDEYHVSHLIVDLDDFDEMAPVYFSPFSDSIRIAHARMRREGSYAARVCPGKAVFMSGSLYVLDLSKL